MKHISERGLRLIQSFEGLRLEAYQCEAGKWTIGWGHTGPDVKPGMKINQLKADELFMNDVIRKGENVVNRLPNVDSLTQNQFDALCSLAFNAGAALAPQNSIWRCMKIKDWKGVSYMIPKWRYVTDPETKEKKVSLGLVNRRLRERELFEREC